jgi:hypothetical protein
MLVHVSYQDWEDWIQESFEAHFYIPAGSYGLTRYER